MPKSRLEGKLEVLRDKLLGPQRNMEYKGFELGRQLERILLEEKDHTPRTKGPQHNLIKGPTCVDCGESMRQFRNLKLVEKGIRRRTFSYRKCGKQEKVEERLTTVLSYVLGVHGFNCG